MLSVPVEKFTDPRTWRRKKEPVLGRQGVEKKYISFPAWLGTIMIKLWTFGQQVCDDQIRQHVPKGPVPEHILKRISRQHKVKGDVRSIHLENQLEAV